MKKDFFKILAFLPLSAMLLSACGGAAPADDGEANTSPEPSGTEITAPAETNSGGPISLTVWGAEEDYELLNTVCENFKSANPEYSFDFTIDDCSESAAKDSILGDVNNAPDVFTFADDQLSSLVASGVLKAVADPADIQSRNSASSVAAASVNDVLYAYPLTADNGYFLYYNKKYFKDSDLSSLDGVLKICADNGKKMTMDWSSGWYLYSFFGNSGLTVGLNDDGISNFCNWNATDGPIKGVDILDAMREIADNPGFSNGGDTDLTTGAEDGSVIAGVSGVWLSTNLADIWGDNLGAVKLPTYTVAGTQVQMSSYSGYKMVGVNSYSPYADWAAKFADFLSNEDNQKLRFETRGQGPSNTVAAASDAVTSSPAIVALIQQSEFASLQRIGGTFWDPTSKFGADMLSGNLSGMSKQEYMDNLANEICGTN